MVNLADGTAVNLTNGSGSDSAPTWSADGAKIAFRRYRDEGFELYVMSADGSSVARLAPGVRFIGEGPPAWSPDGAKIAFDCLDDSNIHYAQLYYQRVGDICVFNADGTELVRLTTHPAIDYGAAWSPDGARIAFTTWRYATTTQYDDEVEIAIMNADGTGVVRAPGTRGGLWPSMSTIGRLPHSRSRAAD